MSLRPIINAGDIVEYELSATDPEPRWSGLVDRGGSGLVALAPVIEVKRQEDLFYTRLPDGGEWTWVLSVAENEEIPSYARVYKKIGPPIESEPHTPLTQESLVQSYTIPLFGIYCMDITEADSSQISEPTIEFEPQPEARQCSCDIRDLMALGCKCGGA